MLLFAFITGGTAGILAHADGTGVPGSILTGGGAFAGAFLLLIAIAHFLAGSRE